MYIILLIMINFHRKSILLRLRINWRLNETRERLFRELVRFHKWKLTGKWR